MLQEFKPTLLFLLKFAVIFTLGSLLYSFYINSYRTLDVPKPDGFTNWVAVQTNGALNLIGANSEMYYPDTEPIVIIYFKDAEDRGISFYEGCNGMNIMILFVAFVFAFGNKFKSMLWYIPAGLVAIHLFNLGRLVALALMQKFTLGAFHFFHKYVFTGIIYAFVLVLWYLWATKFGKPTSDEE